jgi:hypothetical protein
MLKREDNDLLGYLIDHVVDEVAVFGRDELSDAFDIWRPERLSDSEEGSLSKSFQNQVSC